MKSATSAFEQQQFHTLDCRLLYIKRAPYPTDPVRDLQDHTYTELYFITKGKGSFFIQDTLCSVTANDCIMINPGAKHRLLSSSEEELEAISVGIDGIFFTPNEFTDMNSSLFIKKNVKDHPYNIAFYFKTIYREIKKTEFRYEEVCQSLLEILITNLIRMTQCTITSTSTARTNKECTFIKRYIDEHFAENITLDYLAEITHMNKYYMVHAFNKYIGHSPINYLIEKRISESKRLLESTSDSIAQIASSLGFSSQSYFSQAFRKSTNMTPNEYRKAKKRAL